MIVRHIIFFILLIVLPSLWIDYRYLRTRSTLSVWRRLLWWIPCVLLIIYTCWLASNESFIPENRVWIDAYLLLLGVLAIPMAVFSITTVIGRMACRGSKQRRYPVAEWIGGCLGICAAVTFVYCFAVGSNRLQVKHVDLYFNDLPASFDGYRIAAVSDLHVGTYNERNKSDLVTVVDCVEAQKADIVCFVGDLQNVLPEEVSRVSDVLSGLSNVYSVLGNHDYADYAFFRETKTSRRGTKEDNKETRESKEEIVRRMKDVQRLKLGFDLLDNESRCITRDSSAIYIVGTGNYSKPPKSPDKPSYDYSDFSKAMRGVPADAFVVMLQHNPQAWDDVILPSSNIQHPIPQLTLSGHTHGGQVSIGPLRPTRIAYKEDKGLYERNGHYLYVTSGVGGLVPIRIGVPPEIVVITLHSKK